MGLFLHWETCVFQLYQVYKWIPTVSSLTNAEHGFFFPLSVLWNTAGWKLNTCDWNDIKLKFSSRQDNANCMQIDDMIHGKIWYAEQWLGEWELSSARHRSALAKTLSFEQVKVDSFTIYAVWDDLSTLFHCRVKHAHSLHGASDTCMASDCVSLDCQRCG